MTKSASVPVIPRDYAEKDCRRRTDRPAEHGPHAMTIFDRVFWVLGGLVLVAFWVAVLMQLGGAA